MCLCVYLLRQYLRTHWQLWRRLWIITLLQYFCSCFCCTGDALWGYHQYIIWNVPNCYCNSTPKSQERALANTENITWKYFTCNVYRPWQRSKFVIRISAHDSVTSPLLTMCQHSSPIALECLSLHAPPVHHSLVKCFQTAFSNFTYQACIFKRGVLRMSLATIIVGVPKSGVSDNQFTQRRSRRMRGRVHKPQTEVSVV